MKLIFFFLVLLKNGTNPTEGLHVIYLSGQIILKYSFNSYYNSFEKFCCRFYQWNCFIFVNSRGQVAPLYEGRISISNYNGEFEVRITDLTVIDAGKYRCGVRIYPHTYEDVEVTVSDLKDLNGVKTTPLSAKSTIKPAVWMSSSPSTVIVSENNAQKLSDEWRTSYTLAAVLTVLVFGVISMTLLVCRLKTRKKKSTEKSGTCDSANTTLEQNGIIYSMVDFTPHQDPSELYANLQIHSPENTDPSSRCTFTTEESVEYSTILRAPA
ncbi:CMRF35-like molecule 1 isoform X2 [Chanodichthys erythropterus]|uniref:CMRF35-like molecule 1 isoform X2 n=1 Tax=Chanodichthys erythropterus TaxID=933992 RepID=UPI00351EA272